MVDSVIITGSTEGALAAGLQGIPEWATQETLETVEGILKDSKDIQLATMKALVEVSKSILSPEMWDELDEAIKDITKDMDELHERHEQKKKDDKETHDNHLKGTKLYKLLSDSQYRQNLALVATTAALKSIITVMFTNVKTFDQLYQSGVAVVSASDGTSDAFSALRNQAALAGMSVERYGKIVENSIGANAVGLSKFSKTLPQVSGALQEFGFDVEQSAQVQASYLDSMIGFSDIQSKSLAEQAEGAIAFGKSMAKLSLTTGVSRQKIMENNVAISQSTDANVLAATIGEDGARKFSQFIATFRDQNVGQQFMKMMSSKLPALNSTFQNFAKAGLGGLGVQVMRFTKSLANMEPDQVALATKDFVNSLGNIDAIINQQEMLAEAGVEGAAENLKILVGLRQQAAAAKNLTQKEVDDNAKAAAASSRIRTAWMGIMGTLSNIFAPTLEELGKLGAGLEWVNKGLQDFGKTMRETKLLGFAISDITKWTLAAVVGFMFLKKALDTFKFFKAVGRTVTGQAANKAATNTAGNVAGKAGGGLLRGLGLGLRGLGKGAGAGLSGLAEGLKALGSTAVLKGVLALIGIAFSIGVLGVSLQKFQNLKWDDIETGAKALIMFSVIAALLSAAWPAFLIGAGVITALGVSLFIFTKGIQGIGPAMKGISDGIKSFGDINGDNLIQVSKGILALGAALTSFGAGAAFGGIGNAIGSLYGKFSTFFGDKTITEKLELFAKIGPGLQIAANSIGFLAQSIAALSTSLNDFDAAGIAKLSAITTSTGYSNLLTSSAMSVPKNPAVSTIRTPSAVPADPANAAGQTEASRTSDSENYYGISRLSQNGDINSLLARNNFLLEQLLSVNDKSLTESKDFVKYLKNMQ